MKKEKPLIRKLTLNRETLRNLSEADMETVVGGKTRQTMMDATGCPCLFAGEVPPPTN